MSGGIKRELTWQLAALGPFAALSVLRGKSDQRHVDIASSKVVPKAGLEPARPRGRGILNPLRLPFRHLGPSGWNESPESRHVLVKFFGKDKTTDGRKSGIIAPSLFDAGSQTCSIRLDAC